MKVETYKCQEKVAESAQKSEFGKGLTYCISLFLVHQMMFTEDIQNEKISPYIWFNGASDHLFELDTSQIKDKNLKKEIDKWANQVIRWGHGFPQKKVTKENMDWALNKAKYFLRKIDEIMLNTPTIQAQWD